MANRRSSDTFFDEKAAFDRAVDYKFVDDVFVTPELQKFLKLNGVQFAVDSKMFLPSFVAATANAMGMSKVDM